MYIYICTNMLKCVVDIHIQVHMHAHAHEHIHIDVHVHIRMHIHIHCRCTWKDSYSIHMYAHTYIYIYIYVLINLHKPPSLRKPRHVLLSKQTLPFQRWSTTSSAIKSDRSKRVIHSSSSVLGITHAFRSFEVLFGGLRLGGIGSIAEGLEVRGLCCRL